jgi:hypothetical protein
MKKLITFPDGRTALAEVREKPQTFIQPSQVKELLRMGVSCKWIAYYLKTPLPRVEAIRDEWKISRARIRMGAPRRMFYGKGLRMPSD